MEENTPLEKYKVNTKSEWLGIVEGSCIQIWQKIWHLLEIVEGGCVEEESSEEKSRNCSNDGIHCARHLGSMTLVGYWLILIIFCRFVFDLRLIDFEHLWLVSITFDLLYNQLWLILKEAFYLIECVLLSTLSLSCVGSKPAMMLEKERSVLFQKLKWALKLLFRPEVVEPFY